jgi:hypothetical protein
MATVQHGITRWLILAVLVLTPGLEAQGPIIRRPPQGGHGFLFRAPRISVGLNGGFNLRSGRSDVFEFFTDTLTLTRKDLYAFGLAGEIAIAVAEPLDLVLSGGHARRRAASEFRNYVDQNDLPIAQTTMLATTPLSAAVRWYLAPRGRQIGRFVWIPSRLRPYVGAGAGMVRYELEQEGSFVDFTDYSIFDDRLTSDGWAVMGLVMAGAHYSLGTRVFLSADARYSRANAELRRDFSFADGIDLSGLAFSAGLHLRL